MRCKTTNKPLPPIWRHPDLPGQRVSAFTRQEAFGLVKAICLKELDVTKFARTGNFAWRRRIISTPQTLAEMTVAQSNMKSE